VESKLEDCQMGFRPNRSTIDNIFIVKQIIEKCHEFNIELHNVFIDYIQAFDSVYRDKIIKCLNIYEIPSKIIKLTAKTLQDTKARVKINQNYTENFEISTGVKQGDPLSATLFSIVIDDILTQPELRGNISTSLKQCSAYADDILITARNKQTLIDTSEKLKNISSQFGLIVNKNKTKYMKCTRKETQLDRLKVENMQIDQVRSFNYLGTIVIGNNTLEEEIRERIAKGNKPFYANKTIFKSKLVSRISKLKLYWSVIRPIVVYGCETWVLKESIIQRLSVFERKILRNIFGPTKEDNGLWRIKMNKELDELIKHLDIINYVKSQSLSWFGHINRMPETSIARKI
jgi:hypothetical protein